MSKATDNDDSRLSTIAAGVEIVGEIKANGNFRIVGKVKGNITLSGRLVLDGPGVVEGEVVCQSARLAGKLDGKIKVDGLLELTETARVQGEIITGKLKVDDGAIFSGTCDMKATTSAPEKK